MRTSSALRTHLGLTQQEKADWLGVSRSEINMAERGQRSLPTHARLKLHSLEQARKELDAAKQPGSPQTRAEVPGCKQLLTAHLATCQSKLFALQDRYKVMETRHNKLEIRQQTLALIEVCSTNGCSEGQEKWLAYQTAKNSYALNHINPGKLYMMQHKINMLLAEIAATEQVIASFLESKPELS